MNPTELARIAAEYQHNPTAWVLASFPWGTGELAAHSGPRQWQRDVMDHIGGMLAQGKSLSRACQVAVASGHGVGKTSCVAWIILWAMSTHEDTRGVVTANTDTQLRTKTMAELAKWHRLCLFRDWFEYSATSLVSKDSGHAKTWRIDAIPWSPHNPEAFAGLHNEGKRMILIFDEASAIDDQIWEVSEGALTDSNTELLWCAFGNPTRNTGRFRECFRRFRRRWERWNIDIRTVEGANMDRAKQLVEDYGEDSDVVKVRVRGEFPSQSSRQFISAEDVDAAFGRVIRPEQYEFAPKIIGVDPAWTGDDSLVIGLRQGLVYRTLRSIPRNDDDVQMAAIIAGEAHAHGASAVFVDAGYGTGIVSAGKSMGHQWHLVWFAGKPMDPGYANKRAEMWGAMKQWLKDGGCIEKDQELYDDLVGPETKPRLDGKVQLESKEEMKKRDLPSPNKADALALTFAFPVSSGLVVPQTRTNSDYDPLA